MPNNTLSFSSATAPSAGNGPVRPRQFLTGLKAGDRPEDLLVMVAQKDLRTTTNGGLYIHLVFKDRTGQMPGRIWQANQVMFDQIPEGGFITVRGRLENYKGAMQFIVEGFRPADRAKVNMADFLPKTPLDQGVLYTRLLEILPQIKHPDCKAIVDEFLADGPLMERFKDCPAAMVLHHAYIGGLLEHTVAVLELALLVIPRYKTLSLDLVLTGLFLHDIAKTYELTWDTAFGYSDGGQLVGHVVKAAVWVEQKAAAVGQKRGQPVAQELVEVLQHLIVSHHGEYEFGAPKLPATPEAIAIHYLDNLDAKLHQFLREIDSDPDKESHWTNYNKALETKIYKLDPTAT